MTDRPPPGGGRGTGPPGDDPRNRPSGSLWWRRSSPTTSDGRPSTGGVHGSPDRGEGAARRPEYLHRWSSMWPDYLGRVRDKLSSSAAMEKSLVITDLPRLSLYNHVVYGPPISPEEETQLLQQVDYVLQLVQTYARAMDAQPVQLNDMELHQDSTSVGDTLSIVVRRPSPPMSVALPSPPDAKPWKKKDQNRDLIHALQSFSTDMKVKIAVLAQNKIISEEFAQDLSLRIDCIDENMDELLKKSWFSFSYPGLLGMLTIPEWVNTGSGQVTYYTKVVLKLVTVVDCVMDNIGTSPCQYSSIGKEARRILTEDFHLKKIKMNSDPYDTTSFGVGAEWNGAKTIRQMMMNVKWGNTSIFMLANSEAADVAGNSVGNFAANAVAAAPYVENDVVLSRLSLDRIYGNNLKAVFQCQYPSLNAKIDIEGMHAYLAYGGGLQFHRANPGIGRYPAINFSGVIGVKCFGVGGEINFDAEKKQVIGSAGIVMRTNLCAIGLTFTQPGTYRASICKKLVDSTMTVAAEGSYSSHAGENQALKFTVGLKHSVDPTLHFKARAGTSGASVALKKSYYAGKCAVKAAAHVDYNKWWRPKFGVVVSLFS